MVECLPSMLKVLGSVLSTRVEKKQRKEWIIVDGNHMLAMS